MFFVCLSLCVVVVVVVVVVVAVAVVAVVVPTNMDTVIIFFDGLSCSYI